jgi:hypothetical protein
VKKRFHTQQSVRSREWRTPRDSISDEANLYYNIQYPPILELSKATGDNNS